MKLMEPATPEGLTDPDDVPEPPDEATAKPGDLWLLGNHRLLCGDSSKAEDVDRLLNGVPVHLVNTDPPYNVKVEPRSNNAIAAGLSSFEGTKHHQKMDVARHPEKAKPTGRKLRAKDRPLANDFVSDAEFDRLLDAWFGNIARVLLPGRSFYIWGGYANCGNYPPVLKAAGLYFSQAIIWDKEHPVLTRKDYMGAHEWCCPLTAVLVSGVGNGSLNLGADGSFSYTPAVGFVGVEQFTYWLSDGILDSLPAIVTLDVVNATPIVRNDEYSVRHGQTLETLPVQGVLGNDNDLEGNILTVSLLAAPNHGTVILNPDGSFTYIPETEYVGVDGFNYRVSDGHSTGDGMVVLSVTNDAPSAAPDQYSVSHGQSLEVATANGVLLNDHDGDGDALTATLSVVPAHGSISFNNDGSFSYVPASGFVGEDEFTYVLSDGRTTSEGALVTIIVNNVAPAALDDTYEAEFAGLLNVPAGQGVLSNDYAETGETLTAELVAAPTHGTVALNSDGSFTFTAQIGFAGTDSFTYRSSDGLAYSEAATVFVIVRDTPPEAQPDFYTLRHGQPSTIDVVSGVLGNDTGASGAPLSAVLVDATDHGTITLNSDGSFNYTPNAGYVGDDEFTYRISDGISQSEPVTVDLWIRNVRPDAQDDGYFVAVDGTLNVSAEKGILANDTDDPGETLTIAVTESVAHGTLSLAADGSFVYIPTAGYIGLDQFRYLVSDGAATSRCQSMSFTRSRRHSSRRRPEP